MKTQNKKIPGFLYSNQTQNSKAKKQTKSQKENGNQIGAKTTDDASRSLAGSHDTRVPRKPKKKPFSTEPTKNKTAKTKRKETGFFSDKNKAFTIS